MFNYRDNNCIDKDATFDYGSLNKEIGVEQVWNLYYDLNGVLLVNSGYTVVRSSSDGCRTFWERYRGGIAFLLIVVFLCLMMARYTLYKKRRRFIPLATDDGSQSPITFSEPSSIY